jgi:transcriptional regulator with XRE-family HTH domain
MIDRRLRFLTWQSEQGLTLTEIARKMDMTPGHLSRIARGERPVSDGFAARFGKVFGWSVAGHLFYVGGFPPDAQEAESPS